MALPTLSKTYQFAANVAYAAGVSINITTQNMLLGIKNSLKGFASNPWTVVSSSNSVTTSASDLWVTGTNIVTASGAVAHSWIVLQNAAGLQLCIDMNSTQPYQSQFFISYSGFTTGGTITARPTATDETTLSRLTAQIIWANATNSAFRVHILHSTDGLITRVVIYQTNTIQSFWLFETPPNSSITGWTNATVANMYALAACATATTMCVESNPAAQNTMRFGSAWFASTMTCEGVSTGVSPSDTTFGNLANEIDGIWPIYTIGIAGVTAGARGRHGTYVDLWFGSHAAGNGNTYPLTGNTFAQMQDIILPWNGTTVQTA